MTYYAINDLIPAIAPTAFVHPTATLIGDVVIGPSCYVGANAVLRGDFGRIILRHGSNLQDTCVMHSFPDEECVLEEYVTVGHGAILHGCSIGKNSLIGMNAVVMDQVTIGEGSLVAAAAFVKARFQCPVGSLVMGNPAVVERPLTQQELAANTQAALDYIELARRSLSSLRETAPITLT